MDNLISDLKKVIEPLHALVEEATSYIEPDVCAIINRQITDKKRIEKVLDDLLNYAGMCKKADDLFKRLCNFLYFTDPTLALAYIVFHLEIYDGIYDEDEDYFINSIDVIKKVKNTMRETPITIITGDTHGDFGRVESMCALADTTKDDLLIILGDVGINYYGGKKEFQFKHLLADLPITMLCIHGNHERRPESLGTYEETPWHGGVVYVEREFPNLLFAKDGEIYEINEKRCIAIGGAYSVDKEYRIEKNWGWWEDEQPSDEVKCRVETQLNKEDWRIDVVLSHTAPIKYEPREMFIDFIDDSKVDKSTEIWLDSIEDRLNYDLWYCGHYHTNKAIDKIKFLYNDFIEF